MIIVLQHYTGFSLLVWKWIFQQTKTLSPAAHDGWTNKTSLHASAYTCRKYCFKKCSANMPRTHLMTFEPTGDMCALLLVGMAWQVLLWRSAICNNVCDKVWEGWQSVRWKSSLSPRKWARFQTPHRTQGYGRFSRRPLFASLAAALSYSSISPQTSQVSDYLLSLCLRFHLRFRFRVSLLALSPSLSSKFLDNETASAAIALGTTNLHKCTHFAFLNGMDVCAQATPLLAFLKRDKLHS